MCIFIIVLNALGNFIFSPLLLSCFSSCMLRSPMIICLLLSTFLFKIASVFVQKSVTSFVCEGLYMKCINILYFSSMLSLIIDIPLLFGIIATSVNSFLIFCFMKSNIPPLYFILYTIVLAYHLFINLSFWNLLKVSSSSILFIFFFFFFFFFFFLTSSYFDFCDSLQ